METKEKIKKVYIGTVVSDKMNKTLVVKVEKRILHRLYKKYIVKTKRMKVHDENNIAKIGDVVRFSECRHISKDKFTKLDKVLKSSN